MRHASATPGPVGPLPIAVIEAAFRTLLVATPSRAETAGATFPATREATVHVAPITRWTEEEGPPTESASPHQEDLHGPVGPERVGRQ